MIAALHHVSFRHTCRSRVSHNATDGAVFFATDAADGLGYWRHSPQSVDWHDACCRTSTKSAVGARGRWPERRDRFSRYVVSISNNRQETS